MAVEDLLTPEELADAQRADDDLTEDEGRPPVAEAEDDTVDEAPAAAVDAATDEGDDDDAEPAGDAAAEPAAAAEPEAAAADVDGDDDAAEDEDDGRDVDLTFSPAYDAADPAAINEKLKAIKAQRKELTAKWRVGEVDDDAYDEKIADLEDAKDALIEQRAVAVTKAELTVENARQAFFRDRDNFLRNLDKYEGIPYGSNAMLAREFAAELKAAGERAQKDNPNATSMELFEQAHEAVLENMKALGVSFGKKKAAAAAEAPAVEKPTAPAPKPTTPAAVAAAEKAPDKPKLPRAVPKTIGDMPAAAPASNISDETLSKAALLEGEDLERYWASLPAEKRRILDSVD